MYQITGLRAMALTMALQKFSPMYIVQIIRHVEVCGTLEEKQQCYFDLVENIVKVATQYPSFGQLSSGQVLLALICENLIGTEDELLDVILKWVQMNPDASKVETEALFSAIGLERLSSMLVMEELCQWATCPPEIIARSSRLFFKRLQGDVAMRSISRSVCSVDPGCCKFFIRGQDIGRASSVDFSNGNFAMSASIHFNGAYALHVGIRLEAVHFANRPRGPN